MRKAKLVKEITVIDPDSKGKVQLTIYKHENGGMFARDSSFLDQCYEDEIYPLIPDPFYNAPDSSLNREEDDTEGLVMLVE